jgi:type II secretory pathway component GspD/PulD (secretin)
MHRLLVRLLGAFAIIAAVVCPAAAQAPRAFATIRLAAAPPDISQAGRLSISTAVPIPVRDALKLLVRGTRFTVLLDPEVRGTFAGNLKDVTFQQALDAVLGPRSLSYSVEGSVIRVAPRRSESRFFAVDLVNVRRAWQRTLQQGDGASLAETAGSDPFDDVQKSVQTLLSPDGRAYVDRRAGLLSVTDYPEQLDRVASYMEALHARSRRLVRVQARVADATAKTTLSLPELITVANEPVVFRSTGRGGAAFALTVVPQIEGDDAIQLSISPSWSDGSTRAGASDLLTRVANGGTVVVPIADGVSVEVTAAIVR